MKNQLQKDVIEWDVLNWSYALRVWQPVVDTFSKSSKVLAIGERNGGLSLWLAMQGFQVTCTDRVGITEHAKKIHRKYGVADNITYEAIDIVNDAPATSAYDIIIMKSVLGGLKSDYGNAATRTDVVRNIAIQNIYSSLKSGGVLLTADNLQGSNLVQAIRNAKGKNQTWHYLSIDEIKTLFSIFHQTDIYTFGIIPTRFSVPIINKAVFILNTILKRLLPVSSSYISVIAARK
ncbi:hypothetical protein CAP35_03650 [Chitinophagaceae bacterium IBVUCB1]|nr:hypothetical protein CAP35_03650 [Chitinophagaceae bacterium IBVUCB1]